MDLPPQPPPDVPAPPPGPEAIRSRRVMRRIIVTGTLSIIGLILLGLASRVIFRTRGPHNGSEAISNAKQVGLCLIEFDAEYGCFPNASTIAAVNADTGSRLPLGPSSSNEIFRQLFATGNKSEKIFWASSSITPRKPDDVIHGNQALKKGECAFAYVAGLSTSDDPDTPLLMAPVDPAIGRFERRKDYGKTAVILFVDGSVKRLPIDKHGQVEINGMDLFDPRQPFWKGKAPDIKWPE
jgi:hypothetical protein